MAFQKMTISGTISGTAPAEIRLNKQADQLTLVWPDGRRQEISAELLRVESPSAEVQGHGADQKTTPLGKQAVRIVAIEPVGQYAVRISFDDGHDTGIYSWVLLADYADRQDQLMAAYRQRAAAGH
jgi:DUF971 family protein